MYKLFQKTKVQFYTFELKSEKPLKIVIRAVPQELKEEEIQADLEDKNYAVKRITNA